jgi:hypothetical protein
MCINVCICTVLNKKTEEHIRRKSDGCDSLMLPFFPFEIEMRFLFSFRVNVNSANICERCEIKHMFHLGSLWHTETNRAYDHPWQRPDRSTTRMESAAEEILREILLRLPTRDVAVGRCVCRQWHAVLTGRSFLVDSLSRTSRKTSNAKDSIVRIRRQDGSYKKYHGHTHTINL